MKNILLVSTLICLGMIGFSSTALAGKPTETLIAHCGCNYYGDAMEWQIITVNPNSKGHQNHRVDDTEVCLDENDEDPLELDRDFNDCELGGQLDGLEACSEVWLQDAPCGDSLPE
jgi:hypothetical protein